MGNCVGCGKKLKFLEGYSDSDGEWCKDCFDKRDKILEKLEEKKKLEEKEREEKSKNLEKDKHDPSHKNIKKNYKIGLIIIGITLILVGCFVLLVLDSGYYNKITEQKYTIQEAKALCDNPLSGFVGTDNSELCRGVQQNFFISLGLIILGGILLITGILQNLIIYNYRLSK